MKFEILTIFPEAFESFLHTSIIGRAIEEKKLEINIHDIREFSENKHRKVDDVPFGGGAGMVMTCQPLFDCINHVKNLEKDDAPVIFFTPSKIVLNQELTEQYADQKKYSRIILLCGHYEGIDQRVRDNLIDVEISIGNFILTGGELPAQIFIDAIGRLLPGVIGKEESHQEESFSKKLNGKIEYPHYTRPSDFRGMKVPDILISGHHAKIEEWRQHNCK
jgi:tRNA (guanine37-N1)-methyltransferase